MMNNQKNGDELTFPCLQTLPMVLNLLSLNGEEGTNREQKERCQIHAKNDYEAIQCWLNEYRHKTTTFRTYQKEAERLLLWSLYQKQKPLSSLDRDDFESYIDFLSNPEPKQIWCATDQGRGRKRGDPEWRPFVSALSHSAKQTALSCIDSLFNYLVNARYLNFNPLTLMRKRRTRKLQPTPLSLQERMLDLDEWHAMLDTLDNLPEQEVSQKQEKERLRFLVNILYFLGLRIHELATHTWNAFRKIENDWWFYVIGKGNKPGLVPVCDELLRAVITYRSFLKKTPYPQPDEMSPLISSLASEEDAITPRQINKILKKLALETANKFEYQPEKAKKLKKFSAHWLRHLSASMQDRFGIQFKHIRANHRHENDETTRQYVHAIDSERHHDMQKMKLRIL